MTVRAFAYVKGLLIGGQHCGGCASCPAAGPTTRRKLLLFGSPNVGKSVVFNQLTGAYVAVSNYPGTTVEVARGRTQLGDALVEVVDTPGTYSLAPLSEDEAVARDLLCEEHPDVVLHVLDAKNLSRMLPLTLQLIEAGLPVVLDVNIIDEAERAGLQVDPAVLQRALGVPVVATAAATGVGIARLRTILAAPPRAAHVEIPYPEVIRNVVKEISDLLQGEYGLSRPAVALLLLQDEPGMWERVRAGEPEAEAIARCVREAESHYAQPLGFPITVARQEAADRIVRQAISQDPRGLRPSFAETLGRLAMHPIAGLPLLLAVVYFGLYLVVGRLAAGVLVDLLDKNLFRQHIDPVLDRWVQGLLPWPVVWKLFVGEYGLITLGLRYAFAIILPLVTSFFLVFALLEDSGYLPRLAMLVDRMFKRIGLSGRAIIPIVLGLGCDTMAALVTRILETRRQRVIAIFLLSLAIPCSAQLGVILGLLAGHPLALAIWAGVVVLVFLLSGFLAAKLLPGAESRFSMEIPPLRLPTVRNVLAKTLSRVRWYAAEVIPLFLLASVVLWIGDLTGLFRTLVVALQPVVHALGLPNSAADAFLFGFFRRDYGAARLFDAHSGGMIGGEPMLVAMVTLTLFVPCLAQFMIMQKERGLRTAVAVTAIILPIAFGVGYVLNVVLRGLHVQV